MTSLALDIDFETSIQSIDELTSFRFTTPETRIQAILGYFKTYGNKNDLDPLPYLTQGFSGSNMADLTLALAYFALNTNDKKWISKFTEVLPTLLRGLSPQRKADYLNNKKSGRLLRILLKETNRISDEAIQEVVFALLDN
jgi:hypothetical protein